MHQPLIDVLIISVPAGTLNISPVLYHRQNSSSIGSSIGMHDDK